MTHTSEFGLPVGWTDDTAADPTLAEAASSIPDLSDLDALAAELGGALERETLSLIVEGRPGWVSIHRLDYTARDVDRLRSSAKDKKFSDGIDGVKFSALLLGLTCIGFERNGDPFNDTDGTALTYASKTLQGSLGTRDVHSTVLRVWGGQEPRIDAAAKKVLEAAGWGDDAPLG